MPRKLYPASKEMVILLFRWAPPLYNFVVLVIGVPSHPASPFNRLICAFLDLPLVHSSIPLCAFLYPPKVIGRLAFCFPPSLFMHLFAPAPLVICFARHNPRVTEYWDTGTRVGFYFLFVAVAYFQERFRLK